MGVADASLLALALQIDGSFEAAKIQPKKPRKVEKMKKLRWEDGRLSRRCMLDLGLDFAGEEAILRQAQNDNVTSAIWHPATDAVSHSA